MATWDEQLNQIKRQLTELQLALTQNQNNVSVRKEDLKEAKDRVQHLIESPGNAREALFQLPLILHALTVRQLIGAVLVSQDGTVVMHHISGQRLLGIDPATSRFSSGCFFDGESGEAIADEDLPWQKCLKGEPMPPSTRLVTRPSEGKGDLHLEVSAIPIRNGNQTSGVVTLFHDVSETVKADEYMRRLCHKLEQQMHSIEMAQRELNALANKLGSKSWTVEASIFNRSENSGEQRVCRTVLIADDIPVNQQLLLMQLKKLGLAAETANNGREAVNRVASERFAMVFMDLDMPLLTGLEATVEIRKIERERGTHTPIVAMTSFDREGDKEKCLKAGMDDYLAKGVSRSQLRQIVDRYIFGRLEQQPMLPPSIPKEIDAHNQIKLDFQWLEESFGKDWPQVANLFFSSTTMLLTCLEFAIEEKDPQAVNHFAYSLKGPCATIGLPTLAKIAAEITADAEAERWQEASLNYKILRKTYSAVKKQAATQGLAQLATQPS